MEAMSQCKGSVLLLHGLTGNPHEVESISRTLRDQGYEVRVPVLAGHETDYFALRWVRGATWLSQVESELMACAHSPRFVIGLSFGALLAWHCTLKFSDRISGLIMLSPTITLRSRLKHELLSLLSYLPEPLPSILGFVKKTSRPHAKFDLPRSSFPVHSVAALARLFRVRRRLLNNMTQLATPLLLLADPYDHHLSPRGSIKLFHGRCFAGRRELIWYPRGEHELSVGRFHEQISQAIVRFIDSRTLA